MKIEVHVLTRLDGHSIPDDKREVRLFATVRNELARLPHLLDYYRSIGVGRFFIVDNDSTDKTIEFLLEQPDCHVFHTRNRFAPGKADWQNSLLDGYGTGHWTLVVDADELFVFPHCEKIGIRAFCDFLDAEGSEAVASFLLDMYGEGGLDRAVYTPGQPFLEVCPYFDGDYGFMDRPALPFAKAPFPPQEPVGGPRLRMFYPEWNRRTTWMQWKKRLAAQLAKHLPKIGLGNLRTHLQGPPILYKVPLVKWKKGYVSTLHTLCAAVKLSAVTSAILHFKFFSDFHEKATVAATRGQHFGGGVEYKKYLHSFNKNPDNVFVYDGSVKYGSTQDLLDHRLVTSVPSYEAHVASLTAPA